MNHQLTLKIGIRDDNIFANFYAAQNTQIIIALQNLLREDSEKQIFIWGDMGSGRTHLLQACAQYFTQSGKTAFYLPLSNPVNFTPEILNSLENVDLVCIDDIDTVLGDSNWEEALFHFYNRAKTVSTRLVIAAHKSPHHLSCALPDWQSRLTWGLTYHLKSLQEEELLQVLKMRAENRGLVLSDESARFLLQHYPRHTTELFDILIQLDQASLAAKRRLTIPFIKQVLEK